MKYIDEKYNGWIIRLVNPYSKQYHFDVIGKVEKYKEGHVAAFKDIKKAKQYIDNIESETV